MTPPRRAQSHEDCTQIPVLFKWLGSKRALLDDILPYFPNRIPAYYEPFVGTGVVMASLRARCDRVVISDRNPILCKALRGIQYDPDAVYDLLADLPVHREMFYTIRDQDLTTTSDIVTAAHLIFLNRLSYGGMYRTNRSWKFNVPYGYTGTARTGAELVSINTLHWWHDVLQGVTIIHADYTEILPRIPADGVLYLDPPYLRTFSQYTGLGFTAEDHQRLAAHVRDLAARGVSFVLSVNDVPEMHDWYGWATIRRVPVRRRIDPQRRVVYELIISAGSRVQPPQTNRT